MVSTSPGAQAEQQLSTLAILQSVYCMEGEFTTSEETASLLDTFSNGEELSDNLIITPLQATLNIAIPETPSRMIGLHISWNASTRETGQEHLQLRLTRPDWLLRRNFEQFTAMFEDRLADLVELEADDEIALVAAAVEAAKELAVQAASSPLEGGDCQPVDSSAPLDSLVRIWMHLPSLSTKSKRNDLVTYAPSYSITGIVHAGKPGLLILEAPSASAVEAYLSDIKTYSWADIPSSHKKISERLREEGLTLQDRAFDNMSEITEEINVNGMKGVRSNRGDLGALRDWLTARGLGGDRLAHVLGTNLNGV